MLDTVAEQHAVLEDNHGEREALRTTRRQFHTLKGSGRMVGLTELGEIAFSVEKILNRLLEEERMVTPAVLEMITVAERSFRAWVADRSRCVGSVAAKARSSRPKRDRATPTPPAPPPMLQAVPTAAVEHKDVPSAPVAEANPPSSLSMLPMIELPEVGASPDVEAFGAPPTPPSVALEMSAQIAPSATHDEITLTLWKDGRELRLRGL